MSTTVRLPITVTAPGPNYVPNVYGFGGLEERGDPDLVDYPPGALVTLSDTEAERALARFGGDEVDPDTQVVIRTVRPPQTAEEASIAGDTSF